VELGAGGSMNNLGLLLKGDGDDLEAERLFRLGVEHGSEHAAGNLEELLAERKR
jgi:hypothetical protein